VTGEPRIAPGSRRDIGLVNMGLARIIGAATGGGPPNLFTTLSRHRGLYRRWLAFAGALMPGGRLPRRVSELLILRTAHNCGCDYEWHHHERLGAEAGLTAQEIGRVREGPGAPGWTDDEATLLRAADEMHADRAISDPTWEGLRPHYSDAKLIELCLLIGHYEMLAMTLNSLRVAPDPPAPSHPTPFMRVAQRVAARRGGGGA
jgi:alkylhydroperoxidase family enzyme